MRIFFLKRRYIIIYVFMCVVFMICGIAEIIKNARVVTTNATPITNKVIILDAGHGLPDERNKCKRSG